MSQGKYILNGHKAIPTNDLMAWARMFEDQEARRVASDRVGDIHVSTVFLGLDHRWDDGPPQIFETMIFGGPHDGYCERCATWEQAETQHKTALKLVSP